ncbi:acyl-CoA dehydrogenase [Desulfatitalea alkaliphila]|uniref:3-methylmercaptopropionyl-CoA dehydrogenase n=1 Tax=Desulfatitalea alkaliphila TaxID=2929485 RepID=A0AA41R8A2_9BACT|nr:acyl-CoA dehydrogenase [Desulfatitalea alkaliphila]MCJ8502826.1 acyl-CoA dehydrogenase [Desulfatitalea alkaliphila]
MAQQIADRKDVDFVLFDQLNVDSLSKFDQFGEFNRKTIEMIVSEARTLAIKEMLPTMKDGDETGCKFENGTVTAPESFKRVWNLFKEGEWVSTHVSPEWGGQGMPHCVSIAAGDYFMGANFSFMMYPGLTNGAASLIENFGTDKLKKLFLHKMNSGEWTGTMLLTEPEAGSDVGRLTSTAVKNDDGTYSISGNKIFISSGEHDLSDNIIHPVLARIEGAPAGTKGISLFLVPKIWVNDDGSMGEPNDVVCTGIEEKMGIHGNATASLTLGGKGKCRGYLLGEENKGMRAMFLMMNGARLHTGAQGFACASASYLNAVNYARERIQGRHLNDSAKHDAPAVPIIQHPDVRRMLLTMKSYVEGMRSLLYWVSMLIDKSHLGSDEEKAKAQALVDYLTPICKGYVTDRASEMCNLGMQVYGGYGYIKEYPQEQYVRDCRITQIYEGTNGIQAMDLLARKTVMDGGKAMMILAGEMQATIEKAKAIEALKPLAEKLEPMLKKLGDVAMFLGKNMMEGKVLNAFAHAYGFMDIVGDTVMAWLLLWRAETAARLQAEGKRKKDEKFFEGQIKSADFFISTILPLTKGRIQVIMDNCSAAVDIDEECFGGK